MKIEMPIVQQLPPKQKPLWRRWLAVNPKIRYKICNDPGYILLFEIEGVWYELFLPLNFISDLASSPTFTWILGFRPDSYLGLGSYYHDFYYRHGFLLLPDGTRIFEDRGKAFADWLLERITTEVAKVHIPGLIALGSLTIAGWPAWWANSAKRQQALNTPNLVHLI